MDAFRGRTDHQSPAMPIQSLCGSGHPFKTPWLPALLMMVACLTLPCQPSLAETEKTDVPPKPSLLRIGLSENVIDSSVNPDDAIAMAKLWASQVFSGGNTMDHADARLFKDLPSLAAALGARQLDVICISTDDYLTIEKTLAADPVVTYVHGGEVWVEYIVLVNRSSNIQNLAALQGKRIAIATRGQYALTRLWGDTLFLTNGLGRMEGFFSEVREVQKTNQAIIPLFFGQLEAAIVTRSAFEAAVSLNPQLGQRLTVLATSPRLVPEVTCFSRFMSPDMKLRVINQVLTLQDTSAGLQSFTIFKIDRFTRWEPGYADSVRALRKKYADLTTGPAARTHTKIAGGEK